MSSIPPIQPALAKAMGSDNMPIPKRIAILLNNYKHSVGGKINDDMNPQSVQMYSSRCTRTLACVWNPPIHGALLEQQQQGAHGLHAYHGRKTLPCAEVELSLVQGQSQARWVGACRKLGGVHQGLRVGRRVDVVHLQALSHPNRTHPQFPHPCEV